MKNKKVFYIIILAIVLLISGCKSEVNNEKQNDIASFYIFSPDSQAYYWLIDEIDLENDLEVVIKYLIASDKNLISSDVKLIDYKVHNKIAYINLSANFENFDKGDLVMGVNIQTITNTVCLNNFNDQEIEGVSFLLDGELRYFDGSLEEGIFYPNAILQDLY